jgi:hypothetical protein
MSGAPAPLPIARGASAQRQEQRIEDLVQG